MTEIQLIQYENINMCIFPAPTNKNSEEYASKLKSHGIKNIVHFTELEYDASHFHQNNILFHNLSFADGGFPSSEQLLLWYNLLDTFFSESTDNIIGIHCKASVGRAPLMASIALIYLYGIDDIEAVQFIRTKIRNALNTQQLKYLSENYKKIRKTNKKNKSKKFFCC